ncbi:MAG: DUF1648 domain-containing protein [Chloroflexi bacterium]|nr:DUF1648 domain-containing protein [Chloroflexota bacterium]
MVFRPVIPREHLYAWLIAAGLLLISVPLLFQLFRTPPGTGFVRLGVISLLAAGLLIVLVYRLINLRQLEYWVERDALRIFWAGDTVVLPLGDIRSVERQIDGGVLQEQWLRWPARWVLPWRTERDLCAYATLPPDQCLSVVSQHGEMLISPADADGFIEAVYSRKDLGPARELTQTIEHAPYRLHWLYHDHLAQVLLAAGIVMGAILLAYVIWFFPRLPESIPLHFDANGVPDRISPRRSLFYIPAITLLIWFFNTIIGVVLYERERLAAYMLWAVAMLLQVAGFMVVRNLLALAIP